MSKKIRIFANSKSKKNMPQKRILIDLSKLRDPMCGLGQIALNYGRWYEKNAKDLLPQLDITLLVPKKYLGAFGNDVHYLVAHRLYTLFPSLMPRFDLWHSIHQHSPFRPVPSAGKLILTIHDVNFIHEKTPLKQRKYTHRLQRKCSRATHIAFISRFACEDTRRLISLDGKPSTIIYNGVEDMTQGEQTMPAQLKKNNPELQSPFFLAIGEVKQKKQIHTLLPLMDHLKDYRLVIAGNDHTPYAAHLRSLLPSHPNVHMIGIVDDAERRWLYAHCDALLFPSIAEGFGLPLIEAMQWGKPVFCSDKTSLPEIGGPHAHYFHSFNPQAMALTVTQGLAAHTPEKAKAAQQYAAGFSYERHMKKYLQLYMDNLS